MISILLPTDFSQNSKNAIAYALELFKSQKVEFYLLHAYQNEFYDHDELVSRAVFEDVLDQVRNESLSNLEKLRIQVESNASNPNFRFHTISAYNTLIEEANLIAEGKNIDLIVMGTKGKSNERHIVFGSNTFQVLKYVKCPVLAVPSTHPKLPIKHILFPTDYLYAYQHRELALLHLLANSNQSVIDVLYVSKRAKLTLWQEDNLEIIKKGLDGCEVNVYRASDGQIAKSITTYIKNNAIDLLVMVNTQHSFLEDMLFSSTLDTVSVDLKIPLLALQNATRTIPKIKIL
ncbi:universal stress protein [Flavobacteriaceae bacterium F08102]|nr:universal stress protein [Flavobacteriaceae bacterium F08102]